MDSFYSLSRDGTAELDHEGNATFTDAEVSIRCREMGTAEPLSPPGGSTPSQVSIRCREMGTAEHWPARRSRPEHEFLFAVARWGQRNQTIA